VDSRLAEFGPLDLRLRFAEHPLDCLEGADALAINTEWSVFRNPDFDRMKKLLRAPLIFDRPESLLTRNGARVRLYLLLDWPGTGHGVANRLDFVDRLF
jgi:hypothetical protein